MLADTRHHRICYDRRFDEKTESNCRFFAGVEDDESIGCLEINQIFHPTTLTSHDTRGNTKLVRIEQFPSIHSSSPECCQPVHQVIKHSLFV
ncbi:hypothetical protein N8458_01670 [Synechococcus sp. AH-601-P18]|nr:hypothetical protein [Synechococcus sp. AH-601-P18]MDB4638621.1 hypothetical protein [bacterium]